MDLQWLCVLQGMEKGICPELYFYFHWTYSLTKIGRSPATSADDDLLEPQPASLYEAFGIM